MSIARGMQVSSAGSAFLKPRILVQPEDIALLIVEVCRRLPLSIWRMHARAHAYIQAQQACQLRLTNPQDSALLRAPSACRRYRSPKPPLPGLLFCALLSREALARRIAPACGCILLSVKAHTHSGTYWLQQTALFRRRFAWKGRPTSLLSRAQAAMAHRPRHEALCNGAQQRAATLERWGSRGEGE